jgi:drug/metabolite transporter (DMT)-like permease
VTRKDLPRYRGPRESYRCESPAALLHGSEVLLSASPCRYNRSGHAQFPAIARRAIIRDPVTVTKPIAGLIPVLSLLLGATLWGVIWYPLRVLESLGLSGLWITAVSYSAALLVGTGFVLNRLPELGRQPLALVILSLAVGWCNVSFVLAILDGTVVRVLLLFYLSPLWTVLLGRLFLRERLTLRARVVLVLALLGALFMLWDHSMGFPWPRGRSDWLAVSSGVTFALGNVMVRHLQGVSVRVKTEVSWLGVLLVAFVWLAFSGQLAVPDVPPSAWSGALALGVFGLVIMTLSVQYGVTHMPVYRSAVILLFELIAGALSSHLLTDEVVSPREWLGGGLIIVAAWLAARVPAKPLQQA